MKEMINEHDVTVKMLNNIRNVKKILTEQDDTTPVSNGITLTGNELKDEENKFRQSVSPRTQFNSLIVNPEASNVVFNGKFTDLDGMEWQYTLSESKGVYINIGNLQLTDDVVKTFQKLSGYYDIWAKQWANKLANEYKPRNI